MTGAMPREWLQRGVFLLFVGLSVYAQNVTGFALALILLGLVGLTEVVPLLDAVNAVTFLMVVNTAMVLYRSKSIKVERAIIPAVLTSIAGSCAGIALLGFMAANALHQLRMLLGLCIVSCALLLWRRSQTYAEPSSAGTFAAVGIASGLLGGLFSAAGPPLVYLMYRQPWPIERIRESLIFCFGVGAAVRLTVLGLLHQINTDAFLLACEAIPVVILVTLLTANRPPPISQRVLKSTVCILLLIAGAGMLVAA